MGEQVLGVFFFFSSILASSTLSHIHGINGIYYDEFCNKCSNKIADRNKLQKGQCRTSFYSRCLTEEPAATTVFFRLVWFQNTKIIRFPPGELCVLVCIGWCIVFRAGRSSLFVHWNDLQATEFHAGGQASLVIWFYISREVAPHRIGSFAPPLFYSIAAKPLPK